MRHPLRVFALSLALAAAPACASFEPGGPQTEKPAAALTPDQRAYALLHAYAVLIEEAADVVRDPAVPADVKRALGEAERAATPALEAIETALAAYLRARAGGQAFKECVAARQLSETIEAARAAIGALEAIVRTPRG
jgi:hypothetical protein